MHIENENVSGDSWEGDRIATIDADCVRRIAVPGGWLYQVEIYSMTEDEASEEGGDGEKTVKRQGSSQRWSDPVFVPTPRPG